MGLAARFSRVWFFVIAPILLFCVAASMVCSVCSVWGRVASWASQMGCVR